MIGLTKSGKSTFLNAILGQQFLPRSIQPQTAKEVCILHDPAVSNGQLQAVQMEGGDYKLVAEGQESISKTLTELNDEIRNDQETYHKLILRAPILFLEGVDNVHLEVSDTPGLFEAAAKNVTSDSELAIKEMCAFVMILNIQLLKTEAEVGIIKGLIKHHPDLFSKLSRIIILVNAYDMAFFSDNPGDLDPDNIATYVSNYFQDPLILGIKISPEQIIPFSAKWALKSRIWSSDPSSFLELNNARILYDEAVIMLKRSGYGKELKPFEEVTSEDIETISTSLLEFSHITIIEERLRKMLHANAPAVLLEAAMDDTTSEINNILELIETKIKVQSLEERHASLSCKEQLLSVFTEVEGKHRANVQPPPISASQISSIIAGLRGSLDSQISTIFRSHMTGYHGHEDSNAVYSRICSVKPLLTNPAHNEMQASWSSVEKIARHTWYEYANNAISALNVDITSSLTSFHNPLCTELAASLSQEVSTILGSRDLSVLLQGFPGLSVSVDGNIVTDNRLNHIRTVYETKWKIVEYRKRRRRRRRRRRTKNQSFQSATFYPDIATIQSIFTSVATNPWVESFSKAANNALTSMSNSLMQGISKEMEQALASVRGKLVLAVQTSREELQSSQDLVDKLTTSKNALIKIQEDLKAIPIE